MLRIAIPSEDEKGMDSSIAMHFGRCKYYTFIDIDGKKIKNVEIIRVPYEEHGYGDLPNFVKEHGGNIVIVYGIGQRAIDYFNELGIDVITGVKGKIKNVIHNFVNGTIEVDEKWKEHGDFSQH